MLRRQALGAVASVVVLAGCSAHTTRGEGRRWYPAQLAPATCPATELVAYDSPLSLSGKDVRLSGHELESLIEELKALDVGVAGQPDPTEIRFAGGAPAYAASIAGWPCADAESADGRLWSSRPGTWTIGFLRVDEAIVDIVLHVDGTMQGRVYQISFERFSGCLKYRGTLSNGGWYS